MKRPFILVAVMMLAHVQGLAQDQRASLFCGPSYNYYCTPEQEIMAMRRELMNRQQSQSTTAQQNMARYLELEQKRRLKLEQELGSFNKLQK